MKNRQKPSHTQTYASSQVTKADKESNAIISECKEGLLEIISFLVPTQTMRMGVNREKSIGELTKIAKDHIKEMTAGFQQELELLQSRAHYCERTL
jgi:hypothetical protein